MAVRLNVNVADVNADPKLQIAKTGFTTGLLKVIVLVGLITLPLLQSPASIHTDDVPDGAGRGRTTEPPMNEPFGDQLEAVPSITVWPMT